MLHVFVGSNSLHAYFLPFFGGKKIEGELAKKDPSFDEEKRKTKWINISLKTWFAFGGEGIQCQPKNSCGHYHNYLATKNLKNATLFSSLISRRTIPLERKVKLKLSCSAFSAVKWNSITSKKKL